MFTCQIYYKKNYIYEVLSNSLDEADFEFISK